MGVRYNIDAVDKVLDVLARDGADTGKLLRIRSGALAGRPQDLALLRELAEQAGVLGLLEGR
jgi:hypothetical protein